MLCIFQLFGPDFLLSWLPIQADQIWLVFYICLSVLLLKNFLSFFPVTVYPRGDNSTLGKSLD